MFFSCFKKNNNEIYIEWNICYEYFLYSNIKTIFPCGHRIICDNCFELLKNKKCPICNSNIQRFIKIYDKLIIIDSNN